MKSVNTVAMDIYDDAETLRASEDPLVGIEQYGKFADILEANNVVGRAAKTSFRPSVTACIRAGLGNN